MNGDWKNGMLKISGDDRYTVGMILLKNGYDVGIVKKKKQTNARANDIYLRYKYQESQQDEDVKSDG